MLIMMEKRTLGKTNIKVSSIGIGVMMWLGGKKAFGREHLLSPAKKKKQ
jgi:aryl-alcohol dehydrogenase-like predicted oxidoreductase